MSKQYPIQVRKYQSGQTKHGSEYIGNITGDYGKFDLVKTIKRPLWAEQIGNFSPFFCSYKGKRTLIHSDEGDVSDPFRREAFYANSFFITIWQPQLLCYDKGMNEIHNYTLNELMEMRIKAMAGKKTKFTVTEINNETDRRRDLYRSIGDHYAEARYP